MLFTNGLEQSFSYSTVPDRDQQHSVFSVETGSSMYLNTIKPGRGYGNASKVERIY